MGESLAFDSPDVLSLLEASNPAALDEANFGIIGMDQASHVVVYNTFESRLSGLSRESVLGRSLFDEVAPCMNNYMVAQRFVDEATLDTVIDYVFTLRMRRTPVKLRLLKGPAASRQYILVQR